MLRQSPVRSRAACIKGQSEGTERTSAGSFPCAFPSAEPRLPHGPRGAPRAGRRPPGELQPLEEHAAHDAAHPELKGRHAA
eukprot:scaffold597798_cov28-Prasinocladus_malaysianus.AAC.1